MDNKELGRVSGAPGPAVMKREVWAWAFYDFANSGYTTVVLTTVYSAFFVGVIAADLDTRSPGSATFAWTLSIALANLIVLISGPLVGAVADRRGSKKPFLLITTVTCVLTTACLAFAGPDQLPLAMALLVFSAVAFASGENLIAAFLPEIASPGQMGRISGYGWSLGYFGGLLTLGACLAYINWASAQGQTAAQYVPITLLITAAIFALTAAPTFLWLRERARPAVEAGSRNYVLAAYQQVKTTLGHARHLPDLFRFLGCLTVYQSGVATVIVVAAIYAQEVMDFESQQLIVLIMVVNLTAAVGAFGFGFAQDRFGSVPMLAIGLSVWLVAALICYFADEQGDLWLAGNVMGLAMGATQAGGRALIGQLTPVERSAEFFGLWGLASRAAAILGPLGYGLISQLSGGDHRLAILSTAAFFVVGLVLLTGVDVRRGQEDRDALADRCA